MPSPVKFHKHSSNSISVRLRLVPGVSVSSHGITCAKQSGIPKEIIQRAEHISERINKHLPIQKLTSDTTKEQETRYEKLVDQFLAFDVEKGDLSSFLKSII